MHEFMCWEGKDVIKQGRQMLGDQDRQVEVRRQTAQQDVERVDAPGRSADRDNFGAFAHRRLAETGRISGRRCARRRRFRTRLGSCR